MIKLDPDLHEVTLGRKVLTLPPREFKILSLLVMSGKVMSREEIMKELWGNGAGKYDTRVVDQHVARIRRKIKLPVIRTVTGTGYLAQGIELSCRPKTYGSICKVEEGFIRVAIPVEAQGTVRVGGAVRLA